jgi:metallo-beta-lactamase family protein
MATGGRILHHLKLRLPDPRNTVLFTGYQAHGTKGRRLIEGESEVKIHGQWVPVKAHVTRITGLSAHADAEELLVWLRRRQKDPRQVLVVHGEYPAQQAMAERLQDEFGWSCQIPELGDTFRL